MRDRKSAYFISYIELIFHTNGIKMHIFLYPIHCVSALFSAVENGHLEKARTILESTDVDINR